MLNGVFRTWPASSMIWGSVGVSYFQYSGMGGLSKRKNRYSHTCLSRMAGTTGLEPATYCVTGSRSNQLSYAPKIVFRIQYTVSSISSTKYPILDT